ncbi:MAG: NAD(P)-binding domain-containing protein [Gammaproteobacteria bacterium]|nr:NAD(P)-binding domain-containing protein [Gammaproteobacteria bacterium]
MNAVDWTTALLYAVPLLGAMSIYLYRRARFERHSQQVIERVIEAGLTEPPSLHPVIDPAVCVGSGICTRVCPEKALGIVDGKAVLANPSACIGHGACAASCPIDAITLVFGTERRGIDIPYVKPTFETNVPGIYIAGELGGMGLIGKSAEQGRQAVDEVVRSGRRGEALDLVIVGAGPAGLAATLTATDRGLRAVTIEQEDSLGGTVYHYPRHKVAMTHPLDLPLVGKVRLGEIRKEALLEFWQGIVDRTGMEIRFGERLEAIEAGDDGYRLSTSRGALEAPNVVLAIGRRGSPRKLGVSGEELPQVVYRLVDAEQYRGRAVLVVGGGDSAIEAALALAEQPDTTVALSYRSEAFSRAKPKNRDAIAAAGAAGRVQVLLQTDVVAIEAGRVHLRGAQGEFEFAGEAVIVCAGGILPMGMLKDIGIMVETKYGTA